MRKVPFFNYQAVFKEDEEKFVEIFRDVGSRGAYILQKDVSDFEKNLAEYLNVKHAIGVANGTDGLILALKSAGLHPGDEVVMPSHTYVATAASVHLLGGKPVLVECGPDHLVDPEAMKKAVTKKTKFLMPVQLNGRTCKMDQIQKIATDNGLMIIEDAAQGLGSKYKNKCAGTFGLAAMFSFYPAKVLGCFGDGGVVVTNDDGMNEELRLLRDHGRNEAGKVVAWGYNSRLDNLHAAFLNYKLKSYSYVVKRRREIAAMYEETLKSISQLQLPPAPTDKDDHFDIYQNYEIEADNRDKLKAFLAERGVGTIVQWAGTAVHQFVELGFKQSLPITEKMIASSLMLPMNMSLSDDDVVYVCEQVKAFYRQ